MKERIQEGMTLSKSQVRFLSLMTLMGKFPSLSLFRSLSSRNATRLQYVQNALARVVTGASKYTHITSTLRTLHWLPVRQRIIFKTLVLVYKYLTTGQPKYFAPYLPLYKSAVNTRRSNPKNLFLLVPSYCPSIH